MNKTTCLGKYHFAVQTVITACVNQPTYCFFLSFFPPLILCFVHPQMKENFFFFIDFIMKLFSSYNKILGNISVNFVTYGKQTALHDRFKNCTRHSILCSCYRNHEQSRDVEFQFLGNLLQHTNKPVLIREILVCNWLVDY